MLEKHFETILSKYPELIEEGIKFSDRQIYVGGKFVDLLFEDRFGQKLIVELKKGPIKREHIAQLLDYEGYFLASDDPNIRVMLIGNRVPHNLRKSLDHHGFEWKEIQISKLIDFLKKKEDKELLKYFDEGETSEYTGLGNEKNIRESPVKKKTSSGLPQLRNAYNYDELKEIINIRSSQVPSCYMDKLLLENVDKPLSYILKYDWRSYAEKINDKHFPTISKIRQHIKYRQKSGWEYEFSGSEDDPIVRHVGYKK